MKLRILLVDDEPYARKRLRKLLETEPDVEAVWESADGFTAQDEVAAHQPNLLFLDIQMPGLDGFEFIAALQQKPPAIVFVTAYPDYALKAFEAQAVDYLMKPVAIERLQRSLERARLYLNATAPPQDGAADPTPLTRVSVRNGDRVTFVQVDDIDWIEADRNYITLHAGHIHPVLRETLGGILGQLPARQFERVSRSAIVNLRKVSELATLPTGEHALVLGNGERVPITRGAREIADLLRFV